jgi:crossover junction endodeoxyribonuclease RuvC
MIRILGIDPGSLVTGWGLVEQDGNRLSRVESGVIRTGGIEFNQRLRIISHGVADLVERLEPQEFAIESAFVHRNAASAMKLGHARAAAICGTFAVELPVHEYAPRDIKQAVVGTGSADKQQVQHMMNVLLNLKSVLQADEADALAVAVTHALKRDINQRLGLVSGRSTRRRGVRRR